MFIPLQEAHLPDEAIEGLRILLLVAPPGAGQPTGFRADGLSSS